MEKEGNFCEGKIVSSLSVLGVFIAFGNWVLELRDMSIISMHSAQFSICKTSNV